MYLSEEQSITRTDRAYIYENSGSTNLGFYRSVCKDFRANAYITAISKTKITHTLLQFWLTRVQSAKGKKTVMNHLTNECSNCLINQQPETVSRQHQ